jgi:lipopolysaccharide transport system permease protein
VETVLRPPCFSLERLWRSLILLTHYRDLLVVLTAHRIKVRYKQSALGPVWAIVQPVAMMMVFAAVFSLIARMPSGKHPYAVFAYAGLLPWTAFAAALSSASGSMVNHASLVTRVSFPREILPVTYVAAALFDLAIASTVLAAMLVYYGIALTTSVLWIVPVVMVLAAFSTAVSLALSAVNVRFRDIGVAMPLLLQFWMFASPVIYPLDAIPAEWRPLYLLNPMAGVVDGFRRAVLDGRPPDAGSLATAALVTLVALPLAYVWFKQVDATMADLV